MTAVPDQRNAIRTLDAAARRDQEAQRVMQALRCSWQTVAQLVVQTGISSERVRCALVLLRQEGWAERRRTGTTEWRAADG